ncbi:hypothetical protein N402_00205 [Helicobacter pylori FD423]|nr:hypothetical protein N402_00205 [Helicobacter pylori FD423]
MVGGVFCDEHPFNLQLNPLKTLVKIQPKLFIKLAQKTLSLRTQDASAQPLALSKLKDDKTPLFRLGNVFADFKEPFI